MVHRTRASAVQVATLAFSAILTLGVLMAISHARHLQWNDSAARGSSQRLSLGGPALDDTGGESSPRGIGNFELGYVVVSGQPSNVFHLTGSMQYVHGFDDYDENGESNDCKGKNCGTTTAANTTNSHKSPIQILPSRFPPPLEKLLERIQNYFSTYNYPEQQNKPYAPQTGSTTSTTMWKPTPTTEISSSTISPTVQEMTTVELAEENTTESTTDEDGVDNEIS